MSKTDVVVGGLELAGKTELHEEGPSTVGRDNRTTVEPSQVARREHRERAIEHAGLSVLVPGLGQLAQGRVGSALVQFGTVAAYVIGTFGLGGRRALFFAVLWNVWSVIDAYRHEAD